MYAPSERAPRRFGAGVVVGAAAGLIASVLLAILLVATGVLALTTVDSDRVLELPPSLGDLVLESENEALAEAQPELLNSSQKVQQQTRDNWSAAYDGASVNVARYIDEELLDSLVVIAIAAPSPGLAAPGYDLELTRLELPALQTRTYGDVDCLVTNQSVPEGQEIPPDATRVTRCQRSDDDLTVVIESVSGDLANDPDAVADFVDEVFDRL